MSFAGAAQSLGGQLGAPPSGAGKLGSPPAGIPPAQPHIEGAPYDVAKDPGWKGIIDPNDHELRNLLNEMTPEQRQILQQRIQMIVSAMKPGNAPPGIPAGNAQAAGVPGLGAPGVSTFPAAQPGQVGPGTLPP
jgi:hypothetical protein